MINQRISLIIKYSRTIEILVIGRDKINEGVIFRNVIRQCHFLRWWPENPGFMHSWYWKYINYERRDFWSLKFWKPHQQNFSYVRKPQTLSRQISQSQISHSLRRISIIQTSENLPPIIIRFDYLHGEFL